MILTPNVAVTVASALGFVYGMTTHYPVKSLDLAFDSLSKSPPLWSKFFQKVGVITDPLMASPFYILSTLFVVWTRVFGAVRVNIE